MAEKILKNIDGNILIDENDNVLRRSLFTTDVIQTGLVFWSSSEIANLNIIDGLIASAYDIRDPSHVGSLYMTQGNSSLRPSLNQYGAFVIQPSVKYLTATQTTVMYSAFLVGKCVTTGGDAAVTQAALLGYGRRGIGGTRNYVRYQLATVSYTTAFYNGVKYNNLNLSIATNAYYIIHSKFDIRLSNSFVLGCGSGTANTSVLEWGWYNRILNDKEIIYNTNALNEKYNIF